MLYPIPSDAIKAPDTVKLGPEAFEKIDHTELYWLGAAGFMVNARGTIIMVDPLLAMKEGSDVECECDLDMIIDFPILAKDVPKIDAILYSHSDDDHSAPITARELAMHKPEINGPTPIFEKFARLGFDLDHLVSRRPGDIFTIGEATVEVIPADHAWQLMDTAKFGTRPFRYGDCVGYKVTTPDVSIVFPGDTRQMEEHLHLGKVDVLAVDVSLCTFHLGIIGASNLSNYYSNAILIPYHYGTFYDPTHHPAHWGKPEDVFERVKNADKRAKVFGAGTKFSFPKDLYQG